MEEEDAAEYASALRAILADTGFRWVLIQLEEAHAEDVREQKLDRDEPKKRLKTLVEAALSAVRDRRDVETGLLKSLDVEGISFSRDVGYSWDDEEHFQIRRPESDDEAEIEVLVANLRRLRSMINGH